MKEITVPLTSQLMTPHRGSYSGQATSAAFNNCIPVPSSNPDEINDTAIGSLRMRPGLMAQNPTGLNSLAAVLDTAAVPANLRQIRGGGPIPNGKELIVVYNLAIVFDPVANSYSQIGLLTTVPTLSAGAWLTPGQSGQHSVQVEHNGTQVLVLDRYSGYLYAYDPSASPSPTWAQVTSANANQAQFLAYSDGYFILTEKASTFFYVSSPFSTAFPALNRTGRVAFNDNLVACALVNRELYAIGERNTEVYWNAGASSVSPYERIDGRGIQVGAITSAAVKVVDGGLVFLGRSASGAPAVYQVTGGQIEKISDQGLEQALLDNLDALPHCSASVLTFAWTKQFVLNLTPSQTWVYDLASKSWLNYVTQVGGQESGWMGLGSLESYVAGKNLVFPRLDLAGSSQNGVCICDFTQATDCGNEIWAERVLPSITSMGYRYFIKLLSVVYDNSAPLPGQIVVRVSRDGGASWAQQMEGPLFGPYQFGGRQRFHRLGSGRNLSLSIRWKGPTSILNAYLDVEQGGL